MQRTLTVAILLALGLPAFLPQNLLAQTTSQPVQRWEYFSSQICDWNEFNKFGDDGWELAVATRDPNSSCGYYTFKRPKSANSPKYVDPTGQPPKKEGTPACKLTLDQAPKFRGLHLGMTVKEVLNMFPGSEESSRVKESFAYIKKNYGYGGFRFDSEQYQNTKESRELFAGISYYGVSILDDRVIRYNVQFSNYKDDLDWSWTLPAWEKKLSAPFNLPLSENWGNRSYNYGGQNTLICSGFAVEVYVQGRAANFAVKELLKPTAEEKIEQRRKDAMEKIRQEFKINP